MKPYCHVPVVQNIQGTECYRFFQHFLQMLLMQGQDKVVIDTTANTRKMVNVLSL